MKLKFILLLVFALLFILGGSNHFLNPQIYLSIMPPYLPWHSQLVFISGIAELLLGFTLLIPTTRKVSARGLIALLIAIFPANLHMALHSELYPILASLLWLRLPLQALLIAWAYWYA